MLHKEITDKVLRAFYDVYNELGYGFLERVYQNAMMIELKEKGLVAETEKKLMFTMEIKMLVPSLLISR